MADTFDAIVRTSSGGAFVAKRTNDERHRVHREGVAASADAPRASASDGRRASRNFAQIGFVRRETGVSSENFFGVPRMPSTTASRRFDAPVRSRHRMRPDVDAYSQTPEKKPFAKCALAGRRTRGDRRRRSTPRFEHRRRRRHADLPEKKMSEVVDSPKKRD
ncbi:hypothetical protein [Lysobacter changpingensis]|uniref:hypothetical protein n=1 Tax=Lysobacter changpingensis TaxID=2792784 RepID=UPI001A8FADEA|nr:hypothetical protein [Lysobacter changpingensis]